MASVFLLVCAMPANAYLDGSISSSATNIHIGDSVYLYGAASYFPQVIPYSGPGTYYGAVLDYAVQGYASFDAPGSEQGSDFAQYWWVSYGYGYFPIVKFTYNNPGQYNINYQYQFAGSANIWGIVQYDDPDVTWPTIYLSVVPESLSGSGNLAITVDVPEPSTWAMIILGFCGLGLMAHRRKQSGGEVAAA